MTWLDKLLHLLGLVSGGLVATTAAMGVQMPKGIAIAAGVTAYVATGAARSFMASKASDTPPKP